ncbi:MAG TPA: ATP-binding protein [Gemmatimonadaceae bacterium]|jgi:signal transduction histidine kinase|nr:ATP-binding protein [Gemmatimonadaceae bacterium]
MRLAQRLLLASLLVIGLLVVFVLLAVEHPLRAGLVGNARAELAREAGAVGARWRSGMDADSLADAAAVLLGRRVTLVTASGTVAGDSDLPRAELARWSGLAQLPEIVAAARDSIGWAPTTGEPVEAEELRVAVRAGPGVVRVVADMRPMGEVFAAARRALLAAGAFAMAVAVVLALSFSRLVARPVVELREVTQALAAGDLTRRPALSAPGEVGDLASAIYRLAEQLNGRLDALKAEEALSVALIDSLAEGVVTVSPRKQVVRINATGRLLLDVGAPVPFPAEHLPRDRTLREALEAALAGEASDVPELALGDRTVTLTARPLPNGGAVLAIFDLTPVKRLEMVRRDFVANVSHELKTPLTVISGFAETLTDDALPEEQRRRFVETIRANASRMERIVDDLLDLSRIESGGWVPKPRTTAVRAAASEALAAVTDEVRRKGLVTELTIAPGAELVYADPTALRQVLGNLVDNAVRHTQQGTVRVFARSAPGAVLVGVEDTGSGIAADHLPRIFERFYRVDPGRSREAGGTGLGLSIVRHLVEAHGGRVTAESSVGRGTVITAAFPHAGALGVAAS